VGDPSLRLKSACAQDDAPLFPGKLRTQSSFVKKWGTLRLSPVPSG
jgi:hypothetical protein